MHTNATILCRQPMGRAYRVSSDRVWPLRRADGRTWAEAKADAERKAN